MRLLYHSTKERPQRLPLTPMKILYIITKANWGGAQRYVFDLATAAHARGDTVTVAYGESGLLIERLASAHIETINLEGLGRDVNVAQEWKAFLSLLALMRATRPDVVHVNSSKGGLALLAARIQHIPRILFTAHGFAFNEERSWWQKLLLRGIYVITVLLAHETICVSDAVLRDITLPFLKKKLVTIKNGVDAPKLRQKRYARQALCPSEAKHFWIGMLAELHPTKRIEDAIDALAELAPEFPEARLVVMGEGQAREALEERIAARGMQERVRLVGFIPDAATYLNAFDVFLMISHSEALGYALLEAGTAGLPCVATRAGGMPEVITHQEHGLLVPSKNPAALARALRTLMTDADLRKRYGAALKERVGTRFSKERMLSETLARYEA